MANKIIIMLLSQVERELVGFIYLLSALSSCRMASEIGMPLSSQPVASIFARLNLSCHRDRVVLRGKTSPSTLSLLISCAASMYKYILLCWYKDKKS